ncbi:putative Zn(II)2Cys6 transcription factor [Cladorrhinum samala]|uniref:Zn(II)2Cys6 transcription factor n=1 Tax=Cladorrhinum samala TaxID=585594 RepID=A0AAV9HB73_9PEZI|nr:putative Zn(II)2Cys6 transcription factor [Cladorrhinum samala]
MKRPRPVPPSLLPPPAPQPTQTQPQPQLSTAALGGWVSVVSGPSSLTLSPVGASTIYAASPIVKSEPTNDGGGVGTRRRRRRSTITGNGDESVILVGGSGAGSVTSSGLGGDNDSSENGSPTAEHPHKKKQKRNKPTLSCFECVGRKTKCDRGRPHCLACIKRQTECKYAHVANVLEETNRSSANERRMTKGPKKKPEGTKSNIPNAADRGFDVNRLKALGSVSTSTGLLSNVPYSAPGSSNVFGIGSEHPFANYWTCEGGLPEVISVLPDKLQADILLSRYFECVDPVYPMLHRQTFYADYEHFWSLHPQERNKSDASFVALIFVMLALGTQFVTSTSPQERKQTAEFYASASNQALRMSSYLSIASIRSVQAMVLITYFLINDNHASDGWAFAGILMRQAYAMGLHRDPNIVVPDATPFEKQQRRKVWQAVLLQDTFLTVLLSLPPTATHTDVSVDDLIEDDSSIASDDPTDVAYIRGSWTLANLVQETICSPRSLDVPICTTVRHKSKLVADFRAVYRSFPGTFRYWEFDSLREMCNNGNKRVVRQTLFLSSNYYHNLMLVHASENLPDVPVNVRMTLEAAHEAIQSFFVYVRLFEAEARVWWVFCHRAFLEALCIGNVLREVVRKGARTGDGERDPLFLRAKDDILKMIEIMQSMAEGEQASETARTRVQVLSELLM